ncbi:MAG: AAA family ATPase [gamma proteobacterium endosymbiont of Lamellibrachia anaximandri]|nr:AAA family ATPase [gamma proteobacterium endosymbiont of Lamellibrachia anaximandri]MBL3535253.1 AAA family ATPase [gamma proteobacterium endosymbiont of Lamellibrachia anaximandri]
MSASDIRQAINKEDVPVKGNGEIPSEYADWAEGEKPPEADQQKEDYPVIWLHEAQPHFSEAALIRGLIKLGTMIVVYGESNSGKTFCALDLAFHIATGIPWHDREIDSGLAVYVAAEGSQSVENRVVALREEKFPDHKQAPFVILPKPIDLLRPGADTEYIIRMIRHLESECGEKCVLVVGDTLNRLLAGGNENSSEDMGALVRNADRIREEIGCAFAFIHHSGKDGAKGARGHSSLRAATDTEIEVSNNDGLHTVKVTKQRDFDGGDEFYFTLKVIELGQDQHGHPVTTCVPEWSDNPSGSKSRRNLTPTEKTTLALMQEVMSETKRPPPAEFHKVKSNRLKTGQFACPVDDLRGLVIARGVLGDSDKQDSQRKALRRSLKSLQTKGFIQVYEDWTWLTDTQDMAGQA